MACHVVGKNRCQEKRLAEQHYMAATAAVVGREWDRTHLIDLETIQTGRGSTGSTSSGGTLMGQMNR